MSSVRKNISGYSVGAATHLADGAIWIRSSGHGPGGILWDGNRRVERYDSDFLFWNWMAGSETGFNHSYLPKLQAEHEKALAENPALALEEAQLGAPGRFVLMPPDNKIDTWKSLAELSGVDWGPPSDGMSVLMQERHELRRQQIVRLTDAGLIRLLDMGFDGDSKILVPVALERLRVNPKAAGCTEQGKLLCAVFTARRFSVARIPGVDSDDS